MPFKNAVLGVHAQVLSAFTKLEQTVGGSGVSLTPVLAGCGSSYTLTVLPATAVPPMLGRFLLVVLFAAGVVNTGAPGGWVGQAVKTSIKTKSPCFNSSFGAKNKRGFIWAL
jgi:hypothetical protein